MAAEDRHEEVFTDEECIDCTERERSFDALTRGLANGSISRRKALRMLGAALVGSVLASIPGVALAAPPPGACKPQGAKCIVNRDCCSQNCLTPNEKGKRICGPASGACFNNADCTSFPVPDKCTKAVCNQATGLCVLERIQGCCLTAADCPSGNACQTAVCNPDNTCSLETTPPPACCLSASDCPGGTACQEAVCNPDNTCGLETTPPPACCLTAADCPSGNACQTAVCNPDNTCSLETTPPPACCLVDNDCQVEDVCQQGTCNNNVCVFTTIADCCLTAADCPSGNACQTAVCNPTSNTCEFVEEADCCTSAADCPTPPANTCQQATCNPDNTCGFTTTCTGDQVCCPGTNNCKLPSGAPCNGNGNCCTNSCRAATPGANKTCA